MKFFATLIAFCSVLHASGHLWEDTLLWEMPYGETIPAPIPDTLKRSIDTVLYRLAKSRQCRITGKFTDARGNAYYSGFDGRMNQPIKDFTSTIDIGSCTKMFTAGSILQLVEQGKISLDDHLVRVLPDPSLYNGLSVFDGKDYIDSITIRHLLNHTSGFADYFMGDDKTELRIHGDSTLRFTPRQLIRTAARVNKPKFRPGTSFGYSNVNYILLGMILEKYTGLTYQQYVQRNILDPLRLKHTYFASINSPAGRAPGHYEGMPSEMPATMAGAAGEIVSTPDDMQVFIKAWSQGKLFRLPATMAMVQSADFHEMGSGIRYGLGVVNLMGLSLGHGGQTFGFSSYMGVLSNGSTFVFGIDDAAVSSWQPAVMLSSLLAQMK